MKIKLLKIKLFLVAGLCSSLLTVAQPLQSNETLLLTGTYNREVTDGIYAYAFQESTGKLRFLQSTVASNPSFLAQAPGSEWVYAVEENAVGTVVAFRLDRSTGALQFLNRRASMGAHPCYVSVHPSGKWVAVGNYSSGTLAILGVQPDGSLDSALVVVKHSGSGLNAARQASAHVHATVFSPDGQFLLVPDLGMDKVMIYRFNNQTGALTEASPAAARMQPGSGPRHLAFHPNGNRVYVLEELSGSITTFQYQAGELLSVERVDAHPKKFVGTRGSADIHVSSDGRFVYASNRGDANQIGVFRLQSDLAALVPKQQISSGGKTPRNFTLSPKESWLLAANQNTKNIVVFQRHAGNGKLSATSIQMELPASPVCLLFVR
jgi:6-phosphogluconolactonase